MLYEGVAEEVGAYSETGIGVRQEGMGTLNGGECICHFVGRERGDVNKGLN